MLTSIIIYLLLLITYSSNAYVAPLYAEWAHHHVVWINGKEQNEALFLKLIDDYEKRM